MMDASVPETMTAWRQTAYGGPETVQSARIPVPRPGAGEVLVRVRATALHAGDVHIMRGEPLLVRAFFGLRGPKVVTRGMDVAGTVVAVGPGVGALAVDDEVVGELPGGGLAEYAMAPVARVVARPATIDAVVAAALPVSAGTAWQALDLAGDRAGTGRRVLVIGASGGVGTYTVQLAALRGAEVWAVCGARNERLVADLGAVRTFDYARVDAGASPPELPAASFDAVIDMVGRAPLRALRRLVAPGGCVVMLSGEGGRVLGPIGRILRAGLLSLTPGPRLKPLAATAKPDITRQLLALVVEERLRPVIERTYDLAEARSALAHVDAGHAVGKVVVSAG
ncbi:MAG: NAD(P)-dependent alcohol dehydrogenase [Microbacterium sp.]|uniref:NAD(P)-dependent alcohol dehydrogenase n=1 Tax=Microbacterium sp. TaxID=51671 RepID=UPI00271EAD38|nr:NAD(P)-dependent alcohol dehydrogenase [Microbacterium sp.]MDO8384583.1 NAD(P)-dependent alcohol dehydrogenase [Microbacterium sp.]